MDSLVVQPGAAQVLPLSVVGEAGGILPGRLPFISAQIFARTRAGGFPGG
jgi:hypothetical protein